MSTNERQDRTERPTRGRGRGRGGFPSGRGRGGHSKQPSYGTYGQFPPRTMYNAGQYYPMMPGYQYPPGPFPTMPPVAAMREEEKAPVVQKATSNERALDLKAKFAAQLAAKKGDTKFEPKAQAQPQPEAKVEPKAEPKAEPKVEPKAEPKPEIKAEPKEPKEPKVEPKPEPKPEAALAPASPAPAASVPASGPSSSTPPASAGAAGLSLKEKIAARRAALLAEKAAKEAGSAPKAAVEEAKEPAPKEPAVKEPVAKEPVTKEPVAEIAKESAAAAPEAAASETPAPSEAKYVPPAAKAAAAAAASGESAKTTEAKATETQVEAAATAEPAKVEAFPKPEASPSPAPHSAAATPDPEATGEDSTEPSADASAANAAASKEAAEASAAAANEFNARVKEAKRIESPKDTQYPEGVTATEFDGLVYSTAFLKQFQSVVPAVNRHSLREIVNIEAQKGAGRSMSGRNNRVGSMQRDGGRNMSRHGSMASMHKGGRNNSRRKGDRQGSSRHNKEEPPAPVAPLVRGDNAWVPRTLKVTDSGKVEAAAPEEPKADLMPAEDVERRVKSLLNKMSLDNLDRISTKIIDIANQSVHEDDARTLHQIIELTFDKACDEPHWSAMYAKFCLKLHDIDPKIKDVNITDKNGNPVEGQRLFRRFLLSRCQREFEQGWSTEDVAADQGEITDVMSDAYYAAVKAKRHGLGLVRFVGELFKTGFLSVKIIGFCIGKLSEQSPSEEIVESMCKLITTVAPRLAAEHPASLNAAMAKINEWRSTPGFPSRLRFMIMDVEDAHRNGWKIEETGPKTIAEVHQEVAEEQAAQESQSRGGRGHGGFGSSRRNNERDTNRRMERERRNVANISGRRTPAADSSLTPSASSADLKNETKANMFSELS